MISGFVVPRVKRRSLAVAKRETEIDAAPGRRRTLYCPDLSPLLGAKRTIRKNVAGVLIRPACLAGTAGVGRLGLSLGSDSTKRLCRADGRGRTGWRSGRVLTNRSKPFSVRGEGARAACSVSVVRVGRAFTVITEALRAVHRASPSGHDSAGQVASQDGTCGWLLARSRSAARTVSIQGRGV